MLTLNVINNNILLIHLNVTQVLIELTVQYILVYINAFQFKSLIYFNTI